MAGKAWAIKLGSGGRCIPFCEKHKIVGVGWSEVKLQTLNSGSKDQLWNEIQRQYPSYDSNRKIGSATGQIYNFWRECSVGDYVVYYNPSGKSVQITQVVSAPAMRDFDLESENDIWMYRKVKYPIPAIPIIQFDGALKGSLLGPRSSFWSLPFDRVDMLAHGLTPQFVIAPNTEIQGAFDKLNDLLKIRAEALTDIQWELLCAEYFRHLGAHIVGKVGGNQPTIDFEAHFSFDQLFQQRWYVQVKRYQNKAVAWSEIEAWEKTARCDGDIQLCFVSVFGFTPEAEQKAAEEGIRLLEASDFAMFLLSGKYSPELKGKLGIATLASA